MESATETANSVEGASTIKRITKACGACRQSKLRCDGERPCGRCDKLGKDCVYLPRPIDPSENRFQRLEAEIAQLRGQVATLSQQLQYGSVPVGTSNAFVMPTPTLQPPVTVQSDQISPSAQSGSMASPVSVVGSAGTRKRKRQPVELRHDAPADFVTRALISNEQARTFWENFFSGCDRFVPVFDPTYDTFDSVRFRCAFLFDAICTIGCTVGVADSQLPHILTFELKKLLNQVVMAGEKQSLEIIQGLLVIACYSSDRSLILSFATRLAIDIGLADAFEEMTSSLTTTPPISDDRSAHLIRCSRVWFELLVLENMLQVDAGKLPTFAVKGSVRRCRVLLQQPLTTPLDLRLLAQVELNDLRARIHTTLQQHDGGTEEAVLDELRDARIDIDVWFNDWHSLMQSSPVAAIERPMLLVNLKVQRYWCEAMVYFRGLKCLGIDNIDAMSPAGRHILTMAKTALKAHLATTLEDPNHYLSNLRFAMDFVWAKCAFCFLLVLKLTRLLPESDEDNYRLLEDGQKLCQQLSAIGTCAGSSTSRLYVQVLAMSLEKYARALGGQQHQESQQTGSQQTGDGTGMYFWDTSDANMELQSFVPEQFVWEWTFPGLSLWSSPDAWQAFFDGKYLLVIQPTSDDVFPPHSFSIARLSESRLCLLACLLASSHPESPTLAVFTRV